MAAFLCCVDYFRLLSLSGLSHRSRTFIHCPLSPGRRIAIVLKRTPRNFPGQQQNLVVAASTMAKAKKRRKEEAEEIEEDDYAGDTTGTSNQKARKKSRKSEVDDGMNPKKEKSKKKSSKSSADVTADSKPSYSNGVHMDSLQSIFATKDSAEGMFTFFGGDPIEEEVAPGTVHPLSAPLSTAQPSSSQPSERKTKYFFPHFDSPEKNALSLFPVSEEPFFHQRTEYVYI